MTNDPLIERLVSDLKPVRPRRPALEAGLLGLICLVELALFMLMGQVGEGIRLALLRGSIASFRHDEVDCLRNDLLGHPGVHALHVHGRRSDKDDGPRSGIVVAWLIRLRRTVALLSLLVGRLFFVGGRGKRG